jgi:hypothetical protein
VNPDPEFDPPTYILKAFVNDPNSLYEDTSLTNIEEGCYICCSEQPFNSAVAYIELRDVPSKYRKKEIKRFLDSLKGEVIFKGYLSSKGDWNEF